MKKCLICGGEILKNENNYICVCCGQKYDENGFPHSSKEIVDKDYFYSKRINDEKEKIEQDRIKIIQRLHKKKKRKVLLFSVLLCFAAILLFTANVQTKRKEEERIELENKEKLYIKSIEYFDNHDYDLAFEGFALLENYKDSNDYISDIGDVFFNQAIILFDNRDFDSCLSLLSKIKNNSKSANNDMIEEFESKVISAYKEDTINSIYQSLKYSGYDEANAIINSINSDYFSQEEISKLKEDISPVRLIDIDYYAIQGGFKTGDKWGYYSYGDFPFQDVFGTDYAYGVYRHSLNFYFSEEDRHPYIEYYVRDYSLLQGKIILNFRERSEEKDSYFYIYGDGNLLFKSNSVKKGYETQEISIDLTNIDVIRFESDGRYHNVSFVEPVLYK